LSGLLVRGVVVERLDRAVRRAGGQGDDLLGAGGVVVERLDLVLGPRGVVVERLDGAVLLLGCTLGW